MELKPIFQAGIPGFPNSSAIWLNCHWNLLQLSLPDNPHHFPTPSSLSLLVGGLSPVEPYAGWLQRLCLVRSSCANQPGRSSNGKSMLLTGLNFEPAVVANLSCPSGSSEPSSFLFQKFPNQILTSLHSWIQRLHAPHKIFRQKHDLSSSCGQQQFGQARMLFQCQKHGMPHGFHGPSHVPLFSDLAALQLRVPGQSLQAPYGRIFFGDLVQLPLALLVLKLKGKEQMKWRFPDRVLWISNRNHMIRWQSCKRLVWGNHDVVFRMFLHFARWRMKQK